MTSVLQGNRFSPITPNDHAGSIWISTLLCLVYSILVITVRAHLRRKIYGTDDYLILAATFLHVGEAVAVIIGLQHGVGQTISLLRSGDVTKASQSVFTAQILFIGAACFAKCSTLYLMMRLFNLNGSKSQNHGTRKIHWWACIGMLGVVALWGIGSIVGISVDCSADNIIRASGRAQCPNQVLRWKLVTAFDVATEILLNLMAAIIVIPVQLRLKMKFHVVLAFLFRLPLVPLSILRLYYVEKFVQASNPGLAIDSVLIIQQVYICWSIISATIPNLKAFVRSFGSGFGIGIDMETYANAYGSKHSARNGYELGSVHGNSLASRKMASKHDNRSYNEVEHQAGGVLPMSRTDGNAISRIDAGSIGSEDSQQHIIKKDVQWNIRYEDAPQSRLATASQEY